MVIAVAVVVLVLVLVVEQLVALVAVALVQLVVAFVAVALVVELQLVGLVRRIARVVVLLELRWWRWTSALDANVCGASHVRVCARAHRRPR